MTTLLFWLFALPACLGAVAVVIERNVVRMAFWLVVSLGSVAGLFFLLGADFVGATQLLVYVGGTIVLLIFGVMLTATGSLSQATTIRRGERLLAGIIGASLLSVIGVSALAVDWTRDEGQRVRGEGAYAQGGTTRPLGLMLLGLDLEGTRDEGRESREASRPLSVVPIASTGYLLPFEIASMHLLVVLIGAAYLARAKRRREA